MTNINFEQITYDAEAEMGYIYLTEPNKFEVYTEHLPENPEIVLDLGKEVPIVGIELEGTLAKKISLLTDEQKRFNIKTDDHGHDYYCFKLEDKPVKHSISYERIVDVKFLFADDEFLDFIGIEVYSDNPHYTFIGCQPTNKEQKSKGIIKKVLDRFGK
jgi:uncharacterized protein YuzE